MPHVHVSVQHHKPGQADAHMQDFANRIKGELEGREGFQSAEAIQEGDSTVVINRWETAEQAESARQRAKAHHAGRDGTKSHVTHVGEQKDAAWKS